MGGTARVVVLVEGESDRGALETLARRMGHDPDGGTVTVASMDGITNLARHIDLHAKAGRIGVLCDGAQAEFVRRVITRLPTEIEVFVCDADLEDELIRSVGPDWVLDFIDRQGELSTLDLMRRQPAQRGRELHDQLHRFFGIRSGRKKRYAADLAGEIPLDAVPAPLLRAVRFAFEG